MGAPSRFADWQCGHLLPLKDKDYGAAEYARLLGGEPELDKGLPEYGSPVGFQTKLMCRSLGMHKNFNLKWTRFARTDTNLTLPS
jgi:hypothetical protein